MAAPQLRLSSARAAKTCKLEAPGSLAASRRTEHALVARTNSWTTSWEQTSAIAAQAEEAR
eukprot:767018-Hanusia_phi.AAC.2